MRVFVAGATGALGRRIVPLLLGQGHTVTASGRSAGRLAELASLGAATSRLDLLDAEAVRAAVARHDAVVNVATRVPAPSRMLMPGAWRAMDRIRTEGAANVAHAVIAAGVGRLVQESFAPVYPDGGDRWISEATPIAPSRYNRSVAAAEASASGVEREGGTAVVLRYGMLYGPGDDFAEQVLGSIRRGWAPFLGRSEGYLALVTHDDAAAATLAALTVPGGLYNVVDDAPMTRAALATALSTMLGVRMPRLMPAWTAMLAGSVGDMLARSLRVSNRKLREASGWAPRSPSAREGFGLALGGAESELARSIPR